MDSQATPKSLIEMIRYFSDVDVCIEFVASLRWMDGKAICPHCESANAGFLKTRRIWKCRGCRKQFSVKTGTIFEESPIALDKWLMAIWLVVNCKNGISSYELARALGVTQKSAWHMLHRLREAMTDETGKIGGASPVECDETFVGGKVKNMHKGKRSKLESYQGGGNEAIVMGMLERGGRVKAQVVAGRTKQQLDPIMAKSVEAGSHIITDELNTYGFLSTPYNREVINHAMEYVNGHIHTNGIENFWSLLKRSLGGTYISVEPFHLDVYVAEQVFRYNNRKDANDFTRFASCMMGIQGKRLTYKALTHRPQDFN